MNKDKRNEVWVKAKRLGRLSNEEVQMARELGMGPRTLIKNIPNPKQQWKAPVGVWVRNLYAKKIKKLVPPQSRAPRPTREAGQIAARPDEKEEPWDIPF